LFRRKRARPGFVDVPEARVAFRSGLVIDDDPYILASLKALSGTGFG
jgi:hypothetical protein